MAWPRVNPGDSLSIPASLHNATIETVEAYLRHKGISTRGTRTAQAPHQATIWIKNNTGSDLDTAQVLGLDGPLIDDDPVGDLDGFLFNEIIFNGITPAEDTHEGKFAVLINPLTNGQIGRAVVQGVVRVQIDIDNDDYTEWCDITGGDYSYLTCGETGSARVLWREGDSAPVTEWAIVLVGAATSVAEDSATLTIDKMYAVDVTAPLDVTLDARNWLGREIWYTIAYSNLAWGGGAVGSGNDPIGDQDPEWGGHLTVRAHHSGYTSTNGGLTELDLDTVGDGGNLGTARLYILRATGALMVEFDDAGNGCYFRIAVMGYPRLDNTHFILTSDP